MLATRCPACTTAFKIVPDQLKLSQGWVRCGKCGEVFNATQHFVQVPPAPAQASTASAPAAAAAGGITNQSAPAHTNPSPAANPAPAAAPLAAQAPAQAASSPVKAQALLAPEAALAVAEAAKLAPVWQRIAPDTAARRGPDSVTPAAAAASGLAREVASLLAQETAPVVAKAAAKDAANPRPVSLPSTDPNPFQPSGVGGASGVSGSSGMKARPAASEPAFVNTASNTAAASVDLDIDDQSPQTLLPALEIDLPITTTTTAPQPDMRRRSGDSQIGLGESRFGGIPSRTADSAVRMGTGTRPQRRRRDDKDDGGDSVPLERDLRGPEPAFLKQARSREKWRSWPVRLLLLLLVLAGLAGLAAQSVYLLRNEIAAQYPAAKPLLAAACAEISQLKCSLDAVARLQDIVIESSALNPSGKDAAAPNSLELTAVLKNRLRSANRWPALEVTLTDARDVVVVRKVLTVQEYLFVKPAAPVGDKTPAPLPIEPAMRGFGEYNARLLIDTQNLEVAGYRLAIFYP